MQGHTAYVSFRPLTELFLVFRCQGGCHPRERGRKREGGGKAQQQQHRAGAYEGELKRCYATPKQPAGVDVDTATNVGVSVKKVPL